MSNPILELPVKKALLTMAAPAAIGMLLTFLFQLVDTYFVGQLGTNELAAISFSYPVYLLIVSLFMGVAAGVSSTIGKALGEKNVQKAQSLTLVSILSMSLLTVTLGVGGFLTIEQVFSLLGTPSDLTPLVGEYMKPVYLGMFALVGTLIANAALMAKGLMIRPTIVMAIGGITNLVLDYLLILGFGTIPALELYGAGLATIVSWHVTLILMIALLVKEGLVSVKSLRSIGNMPSELKEVLAIAGPAVIAQILNPISIAAITRIASASGTSAVAAYGIATRVESLALTGMLALSVIITPIVAQNFGAHESKRLDQVIAYAGRMTVYWGLLVFLILFGLGETITNIFTDDPDVVRNTTFYFYIVGLSFPGFGLALITTSFFNGVYEPTYSLKLTLIKSLALTIPLAFLGSFFGLNYVWVGVCLANIFGAIYAGKLLNRWLANQNSDLVDHNPICDYISDFKWLVKVFRRKLGSKPQKT